MNIIEIQSEYYSLEMNENATNSYPWKTSPPTMTNRGWMNWLKSPIEWQIAPRMKFP